MTAAHYERVQQLQRLFFRHVPRLRELALANCGTVEKREVLRRELALVGVCVCVWVGGWAEGAGGPERGRCCGARS